MTKKCPADGSEVFDDAETLCRKHIRPLQSVVDPTPSTDDRVPEPVSSAQEGAQRKEGWTRKTCWHCGTPSPHQDNQVCLRPDCRRSLTPPELYLRFRDGEVELVREDRVELGRQGAHGRVFRGFPNVSRRHAMIGVDADGRAWIEPLPTPNGTFVNGDEIPESIRRTLLSGDTVRFALHAEGTVTLYDR